MVWHGFALTVHALPTFVPVVATNHLLPAPEAEAAGAVMARNPATMLNTASAETATGICNLAFIGFLLPLVGCRLGCDAEFDRTARSGTPPPGRRDGSTLRCD